MTAQIEKTFTFVANAERVEIARKADAARTPEQRAAEMMKRLNCARNAHRTGMVF